MKDLPNMENMQAHFHILSVQVYIKHTHRYIMPNIYIMCPYINAKIRFAKLWQVVKAYNM